jgi:hypothetical protein
LARLQPQPAGFNLPIDSGASCNYVTWHFFDVFKIPIVRGRGLTEGDDVGPPVVLINEAMAKRFFKNENPIGHRLIIASASCLEFPWKWAGATGIIICGNDCQLVQRSSLRSADAGQDSGLHAHRGADATTANRFGNAKAFPLMNFPRYESHHQKIDGTSQPRAGTV